MLNAYAILALHEDNWPELESHELAQDEFIVHKKAEDEKDFSFVCRHHEVYLDDAPDIHGMAQVLSEHITNYVWDFAHRVALMGMKNLRSTYDEWNDATFKAYAEEQAYKYAKSWTNYLENY